MFSRLGPAPVPLVCALLVVAIAAFGALVPIGRPSRTVELPVAWGMVVGAGVLAIWAIAVGSQALWLTRVERAGVILVPSMSPGVGDFLFSLPFLVVVPVAAGGFVAMIRGGGGSLAAPLCAVIWLGLCGFRELDGPGYVSEGQVTARKGWLWVRRESVPVEKVRGVVVTRDTFRGAPSFVVKLQVGESVRAPAIVGLEQRFRSESEAEAEAARWRAAVGRIEGQP